MKRVLYLFIVLIFSLNVNAQTTRAATSGFVPRANQTFVVEDGILSARNGLFAPRYNDTTQANTFILKDTAGNVIYTYNTQSLWLRINETASNNKWVAVGAGGGGSGTVTSFSAGNLSPLFTTNVTTATTTPALTFSLSNQSANTIFAGPTSGGVAAPTFRSLVAADISGLVTASEGLTVSGSDIKFGGAIGIPSVLTTQRNLKINRQTLQFTNTIDGESNGPLWQFSHRPYSPFIVTSEDTITSTGQVLSLNRPLSTLFARRTVYLNSGVYRADEKLYGHYLGLTYSFQDTMTAYTAGGDFYQPLIGEYRIKPRNNGYSAFRTGHGTGTNLRRQEGLAAIVANMYVDGKDDAVTDTIHVNGTLVGVTPYLVSALGSGKIRIDNVVYMQPGNLMNSNTFINKSYVLAPALSYGTGIVDSAFGYFDTTRIVRSYHAGNFMIGVATSAWSSAEALKVNGTTFLNGNVGIGVTPTLLFQVQSGGNDFLSIDPTAGAESSILKALNTTGDDNYGYFQATSSNTFADAFIEADFNGGVKVAQIYTYADVTESLTTYIADTHTFTGTVKLGTAGSSTGIFTQSGVTSGTITFQPAAAAGTYTLTWPTNDGDASQVLTTDGSGVLSWTTAAGGNTIYTGDGTLSGDRTVNQDNNVLVFSNTNSFTVETGTPGNYLVQITPGFFDVVSNGDITYTSQLTEIYASNNSTGLYYQNASVTETAQIQVRDSSGTAEILIESTDDITYIADTHTFTGTVKLGTAGSSTGIFTQSGVTSGTITFQPASAAGTYTLTWPTNDGDASQVLTTDGSGVLSWTTAAGGGANTALSNLAAVAINTSLVSDADNTDDLGSSANGWKDIYSRTLKLDGSTSGTVTFASDALANAPNGTTLSGTGYIPAIMFSRLTSNFTMSDVNTVQPVFSTGQDVWTLQASTTYYFEGTYYLTHGAVSHSVGMSFELGGGASLTSIFYQTICWVTVANTNTASQTTNNINQATNTSVNSAGANAQETIKFWGWMSVNAGGTVTPSITFSAAPGGAPAAVAGTYITFTPIGTNTVASLGNVN